jgi:hypothetical protein
LYSAKVGYFGKLAKFQTIGQLHNLELFQRKYFSSLKQTYHLWKFDLLFFCDYNIATACLIVCFA